MRAVISVLRAAGAVKQKYPKEKEDVLMLKSLKDVNLPKFLAHDIPLFEGILMDLFPGVSLPPPDYEVMEKHVRFNCEKFNLQPTPVFLEKVNISSPGVVQFVKSLIVIRVNADRQIISLSGNNSQISYSPDIAVRACRPLKT